MNHRRRVRLRRLLLLAPFALFGAALLVRARLPRPQTEGDKWLWTAAEQTPEIEVGLGKAGVLDKDLKANLPDTYRGVRIQDPEGIRTVLRAFKNTSAFVPDAGHSPYDAYPLQAQDESLAWISISNDPQVPYLCLIRKQGYYYLYNGTGEAKTDDASVKRFCQVLRAAIVKTRQFQAGYTF